MKTRAKDLGTWWESYLAGHATTYGLRARRLPEGGSKDEGDVEIIDANGTRWVVECRNRERLNVHETVAKAQQKAPGSVVAWRRMLSLKAGQRRRRPAGPPIVAMTVDQFFGFLSRRCVCTEDERAPRRVPS